MMQQTATPVPDHGTGWGLLFLFIGLYGVVAILGAGTVVAVALNRFDRRVPRPLLYLLVVVLGGALAISGFAVLVSATAGRSDVVALLLLVVFLPLALGAVRSRGANRGRLAVLARAAMAWSLPFLVAFGLVAFVGSRGGPDLPPVVGVVVAVVVLAGTAIVERLPFFPALERAPE